MDRAVLGFLLALALLAPAPARGQTAQSAAPESAVFELDIVARDTHKEVGHGTGFFTGSEGTALTVSHVVYRAQQDPDHYDLMATVNKEFYSVQIVCASKLTYDPTKETEMTSVPVGRDVAQIRIVPSRFPFRAWLLTLKTGEKIPLATAHRDALPEFPYLTLGTGPAQGDHVRIIGFGRISPIARLFVASGQIDRMWRASDGTEIFSARFTSRPQPGNSGSPVLDDRNQVIGIWPWYARTQSDLAWSISSSALQKPCP